VYGDNDTPRRVLVSRLPSQLGGFFLSLSLYYLLLT
jgi:hypothetical protein